MPTTEEERARGHHQKKLFEANGPSYIHMDYTPLIVLLVMRFENFEGLPQMTVTRALVSKKAKKSGAFLLSQWGTRVV